MMTTTERSSRTTIAAAAMAFGQDALPSLTDSEFRAFRELIHRETGIYLKDGKQNLVSSRLARRLRAIGCATYADYLGLVTSDGAGTLERKAMINAITTNRTGFFRESHHFDYLRDVIVPAALARVKPGEQPRLRIWSAGCSTGEEPYTIAMTLKAAIPDIERWDVRLLATDIDTDVLSFAERGVYREEDLLHVPAPLRSRWFARGGDDRDPRFQVVPEIRQMVTFRPLNLNAPAWPLRGPFDVIFCRNVIIYFDKTLQQKLFQRYADLLVPGGFLFLGHSESLLGLSDRFESLRNTAFRLTPPASEAATAFGAAHAKPAEAAIVPPVTRVSRDAPAPRAPRPVARPARPRRIEAPTDAALESHASIILGEIIARSEPTRVRTLLGSCVAVCLHDPRLKIGGMNHFMLPGDGASDDADSRFGVNAMELLINELMRLGSERRHLQAKVFGAANVLHGTGAGYCVAKANADFVLGFLETERIPVAAQRLGGARGVELFYFTHDARAFVRPVGDGDVAELLEREERYRIDAHRRAIRPDAQSVTLF